MKRAIFGEMLLLLVLSALAGAGANLLRPDPLPFLGDPAAQAAKEISAKGLGPMTPVKAAAFLDANGVFFLDARTPEEYAAGHVKGAKNLPYEAIFGDLAAAAKDYPKDAILIVYCGDPACGKSEELAEALKASGFPNVAVIPEGMEGWKAMNLPTEAGE